MKPKFYALIVIVACLGVAALSHFAYVRAARIQAANDSLLQAQLQSRLEQNQATDRELANLRISLTSLSTEESETKIRQKPAISAQPARTLAIAKDPELRSLSIRAYVNQRRLDFASLFKKLGFTADQRRRFDEIQANRQGAVLDSALAAEANGWDAKDAHARDAQTRILEEEDKAYEVLFGPAISQWKEAAATLRSRQIVAQIIQQNLQGADSFNESTANGLAGILASNRSGAKASGDSTGYNWEAILPLAKNLLSPAQWNGFQTSVSYLRSQAEINAFSNRRVSP